MLPFPTYNIPENPLSKTQKTEKWLLLIVDQPLTATHADTLHKITSALRADYAEDVFCISVANSDFTSLIDMLSPETKLIISFGVMPSTLGIWIDLSSPGIRILESFSFILTLSLDSLSKNPTAKKELWKSMQMYLSQP